MILLTEDSLRTREKKTVPLLFYTLAALTVSTLLMLSILAMVKAWVLIPALVTC
jgi:hypothetical protein